MQDSSWTRSLLLATLVMGPSLATAQGPAKPDAAKIDELAKEIDGFVTKALCDAQQNATPALDDAGFVRRAYLEVTGRIPTAQETAAFLADQSPSKRHQLVDRLVDTPGRVSHEFNFWADLLRARSRLMRQVSGEPFIHWLKVSLEQNKPYDTMVKEMLTAEGPAHKRDNGATGYLLRDLEMPLDSMSNTMRVFLGTRIECAQCHNHPFDKWTQMDFFRVAAFTGGMKYRNDGMGGDGSPEMRKLIKELYDEHGRKAQQALGQIRRTLGTGLEGSGTGLVRLPDNYQYKDAKPNQIVSAKTPFGESLQVGAAPAFERPARGPAGRPQARKQQPPILAKDIGSRDKFAEWLVDEQNPRFAMIMANRVWKRVFGRGLVEPVDDIRDDTKASIPFLVDRLGGILAELRFDLKAFERVLMHTQLFQRACPGEEPKAEQPWLFAGPVLKRMSAERYWDSLLALATPDPDASLGKWGQRAEQVYARYDSLGGGNPETIKKEVEFQLLRESDPAKYREMQMQRNREMYMQGNAPAGPFAGGGPGGRGGLKDGMMARASEMPSPAPDGSPLRQLGQSEREIPDGAHPEANVPELLTLLNGFVDQRLLNNRDSTLRRALDDEKSMPKKIEATFVAVLSRKPTRDEATQWLALLGDSAPKGTNLKGAPKKGGESSLGFVDLVWVLVNSNEFRFIR